METSYLDAKTFGIGQLITQRKLFHVPEHQRDFSWEEENVVQFFEDIISAFESGDPEYFIGLIVLLGSADDAWEILDGQQRLATVTIIYSAIRHWLVSRQDFVKDAEQIEAEFIAVRQLGGGNSPRLTLNISNRDLFFESVVNRCPDEDITKHLKKTTRRSTNYLLLRAVQICRESVGAFAEKGENDPKEQADRLFHLANYLEYRVKAAILDVLSEANAFIIFEALNARGNELSVLDLVKNHIFGNAGEGEINRVRPLWTEMAERIHEKNADDFLKVFWTSRFGRVQKPQLYSRIKREFDNVEGALELAHALTVASDYYIALDDPKHEIWSQYGQACAEKIETLSILGNRQVRAPIMAAIDVFEKERMEILLNLLVVLTIRYQIVGQRRTGALEIGCARLANQIRHKKAQTAKELWGVLHNIIPPDDEFSYDFLRFSERNASRAAYFLAQLEITSRKKQGLDIEDLEEIAHHPSDVIVDFILPKKPSGDWKDIIAEDPTLIDERLYRLGNKCLLESKLDDFEAKPLSFKDACHFYSKSRFQLTNSICSTWSVWLRNEIEERQKFLADLALFTWPLPT